MTMFRITIFLPHFNTEKDNSFATAILLRKLVTGSILANFVFFFRLGRNKKNSADNIFSSKMNL